MVGLLVAIVGGIIAPAGPASADPVSSARAQIAALQSQIVADSAHLHQLTVTYDADALQASELAQQVQAGSTEVQHLGQQIQQNQSVVRRVAVMSYTGEVQAPASLAVSSLVSQAYVDATVGDISDTEDLLHSEQQQTGQDLLQLRQASRAESAQLDAAARARQLALSEAAAEQQTLQSDQQNLNRLLAEVPAPSRPPAVQGLGTGLVTAVRSQVSPDPLPAPSGPASTTLTAAPATAAAPSSPSTLPPTSTTAPPVATTSPPVVTSAPPVATTAPPSTTAPSAPVPATGGGGAAGPWLALRECESGDNYQENTGNGYYGAYQFSAATWTGLGFPGRPDLEPPAMQDAAAMKLQAQSGWGQWPSCSAALGL